MLVLLLLLLLRQPLRLLPLLLLRLKVGARLARSGRHGAARRVPVDAATSPAATTTTLLTPTSARGRTL
jgi:hypothetical protein